MEAKDPKSTASSGAEEGSESKDPKSDATSSETLSDVEETEEISDKSGGAPAPSPDGAFDESHGSTNGIEDAGPM
ncbi:MAG TPA: hypothetical protein VF791_14955 [Pyrinomonadaceae bacterium]